MKPTDLLTLLESGDSAVNPTELVKRLLTTLALRKGQEKKSRRMVLLTGPDDYSEEDFMPCLTRHLKSSSGPRIKPKCRWESKSRPKSAESWSTDASESSACSDINQQYLENAFYALANENRASGGTRSSHGFTEVFICCVKQFFLDSYLSSGTLWQAMRTAFGNKEWINFTDFARAYEVLQAVSVNSEAKIRKKDCFMQNFLMQFKLAESAKKEPLSTEEIDQVVRTTRVSIESLQKLRSCFDI
mmetsp:Transcript_32815/g.57226  ORF Transcript_32815/g.57226 Transcript_32815/m.57226 type:complete len:245 (+) Transcript_32815:9210-9944(+)